MSELDPARAKSDLERRLLRGLAHAEPDPEGWAALAAAAGRPAPPAGAPAPGPDEAADLLLALGRAERSRLEPPRMPAEADVTSTLERLDESLRPSQPAAADVPAQPRVPSPAREAERRAAAMWSPDDLLRLATGGALFERRAALARLDEYLRGGGRGFSHADRRAIVESLEGLREAGAGRAIDDVLVGVGGAAAGRARTRVVRVQRIFERLERDILRYWEGDVPEDPLLTLDDETLEALGAHVGSAPDTVAGHAGETLRRLASEGRGEPLERLMSALAAGVDERLLPSVIQVLQDARPAARVHAARALVSADDPRVPAALRKAFRHAATPEEKIVLAGGLAAHGDRSGVAAAVERLSPDEPPHLVELALAAMAHAGEPIHVARVAPLLGSARISVARAAATALGAFGDASALEPLASAAARPELAPQVERARERIRARLDLAGAGTAEGVAALAAVKPGEAARRPRAPLGSRALGRWHFVVGVLWFMMGRRHAALRRFERAHERHPYLVGPLLFRARIALRQKRIDDAVDALRVALRVRASALLQLPDRANLVVRTYLRHVDGCVASGQTSRALQVLDELLGYDLRFVDVDLRLGAERRRDFVARAERGER